MSATVISLAEERELREQLELTETLTTVRAAAAIWLSVALEELRAETVPRTEVISRYAAALDFCNRWSSTVTALAVKGRK